MFDTFKSVYYETEPEGDVSPWTYLLRYERHENYPKDTCGYFIDALHVFGNISKKKSNHDSIIEKSNKGKEINERTNCKFNDLVLWIKEDKTFTKKVKDKTGNADFMPIAALFLTLKDCFKDGIDNERKYRGCSINDFINEVKRFDIKYLKPALYFIGLTLGWDNIYKYMYKRWNLPILSNNAI